MRLITAIVSGMCAMAVGQPAFAASDTCTSRDPRVGQLVGEYDRCTFENSEPFYLSEMTPSAVADRAIASCAPQQKRIAAFTAACHAQPLDVALFRRTIIQVTENRRARADLLWLNSEGWAKGVCRLDDPGFNAAFQDHLICAMNATPADAKVSWATAGAQGVLQCTAKEAPIAERLAGCGAPRVEAIMAAYRAYAQEFSMSIGIDGVLKDRIAKDAPAEQRDDHLLYLRELLDACVALETSRLAATGGEADAVILHARGICSASRTELYRYARERLPTVNTDALLAESDADVVALAKLELNSANGAPNSEPRH
jgi:hypothetical protein